MIKQLCKKTIMKKSSSILFFFIVLLTSCTKEVSKKIESYSADKEMNISIQGKRVNALDSWMLDIEMTYKGETSRVYQEFYADDINKQNVKFEWKNNRKCMIEFTQRDGVMINVPIEIHE
jgi:outer membrane biogenesis lipoprotein LolB